MGYETKHTPGPWRWDLNFSSKKMGLYHISGKCETFKKKPVMTFCRWGMQSAIPMFLDLKEYVVSRTNLLPSHHLININEQDEYRFVRDHHIDHPDANLIAAAPDLLDALIELLEMSESYHCQLFGVSGLHDISDSEEHPIIRSRKAIEKALNYKK